MKNLFKIFLFFIIVSISFFSKAQENKLFNVVPKQYSFEFGYRNNFKQNFNSSEQGYSFLLDYAWQLSGFENKAASYISVPLGYTYFYETNSDTSMRILSYGWAVRHNLAKNKKIIPFFNYGLLLNQLRLSNTEGSVFGHKTALGFGIMFNTNTLFKPYLRIEYSYTRFAFLGLKNGKKIQGVEIIFGFRIR